MLFIFGAMQIASVSGVLRESTVFSSQCLERDVTIDFFLPKNVPDPSAMSLLLINDGQNMEELGLEKMVAGLYSEKAISPLFCAAIHTGKERKIEYGMASQIDYLGRGAKAGAY